MAQYLDLSISNCDGDDFFSDEDFQFGLPPDGWSPLDEEDRSVQVSVLHKESVCIQRSYTQQNRSVDTLTSEEAEAPNIEKQEKSNTSSKCGSVDLELQEALDCLPTEIDEGFLVNSRCNKQQPLSIKWMLPSQVSYDDYPEKRQRTQPSVSSTNNTLAAVSCSDESNVSSSIVLPIEESASFAATSYVFQKVASFNQRQGPMIQIKAVEQFINKAFFDIEGTRYNKEKDCSISFKVLKASLRMKFINTKNAEIKFLKQKKKSLCKTLTSICSSASAISTYIMYVKCWKCEVISVVVAIKGTLYCHKCQKLSLSSEDMNIDTDKMPSEEDWDFPIFLNNSIFEKIISIHKVQVVRS